MSLTSKSKDSRRRSERCQRHKPSCVDFAFPFAFENGHRFKHFWHLLCKVVILCYFFATFFGCLNSAIISACVLIFLILQSNDRLGQFVFHITKIFDFNN